MTSRKNRKPDTTKPQRERSDGLREHPRRRRTDPTAPGGLPPSATSPVPTDQKIASASTVELDQVKVLGMCKD